LSARETPRPPRRGHRGHGRFAPDWRCRAARFTLGTIRGNADGSHPFRLDPVMRGRDWQSRDRWRFSGAAGRPQMLRFGSNRTFATGRFRMGRKLREVGWLSETA
jgi:hypothetical protein